MARQAHWTPRDFAATEYITEDGENEKATGETSRLLLWLEVLEVVS
jgi:hypothetical protein